MPRKTILIASGSSFSGRIAITFVTNAIIAVIGLATGVVAARMLGPEQRGQVAAIQAWPIILASLVQIGLPDAIVYFTSKQQSKGNEYFATAVAIAAPIAIAATGIGMLLAPLLLSSQPPNVRDAGRIYMLFIIVQMLNSLRNQSIRSSNAWFTWNACRLLFPLAWLATLGYAYFNPSVRTPSALTEVLLFANMLLMVPLSIAAHFRVAGKIRIQSLWIRPMVRFGLPNALNVLPQTMNLRLDQLIMAALLSSSSLGLYVVAVAWSASSAPFTRAIAYVLFPHLSSIPDKREQREVVERVIPKAILLSGSITALQLALTPFVIPWLFGNEFNGAIASALILVVATGISDVSVIIQSALRGIGRPWEVFRSELVGLGATVCVLPLSLYFLGIEGAALATSVAYFVTFLYLRRAIGRWS